MKVLGEGAPLLLEHVVQRAGHSMRYSLRKDIQLRQIVRQPHQDIQCAHLQGKQTNVEIRGKYGWMGVMREIGDGEIGAQ